MREDLMRCYVGLRTLRLNLPDAHVVEERYIAEFHKLLEEVQRHTEIDFKGYMVPAGKIYRPIKDINKLSGELIYADYWECDKKQLLSQLEGALVTFEKNFLAHNA